MGSPSVTPAKPDIVKKGDARPRLRGPWSFREMKTEDYTDLVT